MGRGLIWGNKRKLLYYMYNLFYHILDVNKQPNVILKHCLLNAEYNNHKCKIF